MKSKYFLNRKKVNLIPVGAFVLQRIKFYRLLRPKLKIVISGTRVNKKGLISYQAHLRPPRPQFSAQTRWDLASKQKFKCKMCKRILPPASQIDHITPREKGGSDRECNLQVICALCHAEKTRIEQKAKFKCNMNLFRTSNRLQ